MNLEGKSFVKQTTCPEACQNPRDTQRIGNVYPNELFKSILQNNGAEQKKPLILTHEKVKQSQTYISETDLMIIQNYDIWLIFTSKF